MMNYIQEYCGFIADNPAAVPLRIQKIYTKLAAESIKTDGAFVFDEKKAARPIEFIEKFCKHSKGEWAGRAVKLELFQKAFISALFGFIDRETGLRRFREAFFMVGRKNGKSTMLAGLALFLLIADGEAGAEIYSTATKKDQAKIIFDETANMVQQSPQLKRHIQKRKTDLYFPATFSKFQALGKNADTLDGLNAHCVIMDELHGVKDRNLYEVMKERVIQGAKTLSLPMQKLGADLQAKRICYNNHPILKWCLTNTGIQTDRNGNIVPIKNQSAKQRIDGLSSLLDAYVILMEKYNEFKGVL